MTEQAAINYRGRKTSRARSEQRRKAILEAALRIVVSEGVRGVRHRAVAKEANVPLSATTYYFDDISDLIADTFTLFAEQAMQDVVKPIYNLVGEFLKTHKFEASAGVSTSIQVLDSLVDLIIDYLKLELTEKRDHIVAEQAFKHECLRDTRLRDVAQSYYDNLLKSMTQLCQAIGIKEPDIAAELLTGTLFRIKHEALMVPVEQFDEDKARKMVKRQLVAFLA